MHVGFEAKRFFNNFTGLGNYTRFVVSALSTRHPENTYTLFSPRIRRHPEYNAILDSPNVEAIGPKGIYSLLPSLWRSFGISQTAEAARLDVFHGLSQELPVGLPRRVRKVVTIHDLIFLRYPQYYNPLDVKIYRAKAASACRRADRVIAISHQTAEDIHSFLGTSRNKISVVYQGCHPSFREKASAQTRVEVRKKYDLPERFILNVGTIEERKNLALLVEALSAVGQEIPVKLVVVGKPTKYKDDVLVKARTLNVENQIRFLHNVSFEDLPAIYQMAEVFVYPSRFEGFGIPLVEAIESGIPVISSTGSCFREAAGPHSLYADPSDSAQLAGHIQTVLTNTKVREQMTTGSTLFVRRFEPSVIADELMREYSLLM